MSVIGTVDTSRIGWPPGDHSVRFPNHPSGRGIRMPNSSNASVVGAGGGTTSRATSSFASWNRASVGSFVPNTALTDRYQPFAVAFTPDIERSSRAWPSHPENGVWSSRSGSVRSGNDRFGDSGFLVSSRIRAMTTIPSGGRFWMVTAGSPPG